MTINDELQHTTDTPTFDLPDVTYIQFDDYVAAVTQFNAEYDRQRLKAKHLEAWDRTVKYR